MEEATALLAAALWAGGTETRKMLTRAIQQARRAANLSQFFSPTLADRLAAHFLDRQRQADAGAGVVAAAGPDGGGPG